MKVSIWHHTTERQPSKSGYYLSYRGWGMGGKADGDSDHGYVYYDKTRDEWRDYESTSMGHGAIVYYWTDADPHGWTNADPPSIVLRRGGRNLDHVAVQDAWKDVEEAIKRYETIKALCQKAT